MIYSLRHLLACFIFLFANFTEGGLLAENWPQWRGPTGDSISTETGLPIRWGQSSGTLWKCPLPGKGASSPCVWDNSTFLTSQQGDSLLLIKINNSTGHIDWTRQVGTGVPARMPLQKKIGDQRRQQRFHQLHNMASPTAATDGERVIVHFGNGVLAAYDFAGATLWSRNLQTDYGPYTIWWGHANSPILVNNLVISVAMQDSLADLPGDKVASYLVAHDKFTGKEVWKTLRPTKALDEECDSYTTPLLHQTAARSELIVMGGNQIDGYDPQSGRQLWFLPGIPGGRTITGPTASHDLVFATQGKRGPLLAVRLGGIGELAMNALAWKETHGTPDSSCPVVWKDLLFWIADNGVAQCRDARTGAVKWNERLPGDYKASPVIAGGNLYFLNLGGLCTVVAASGKFEKLAENKIDDHTIASIAVANGRIYIRGQKALYCIGKK